MFRYTIFFLVCFYYCERAKRQLTYREECISLLKIIYISVLVLSIILAINIDVRINLFENGDVGELDPLGLCSEIEFQIFRWLPLLMCAVFQYTFWDVRN